MCTADRRSAHITHVRTMLKKNNIISNKETTASLNYFASLPSGSIFFPLRVAPCFGSDYRKNLSRFSPSVRKNNSVPVTPLQFMFSTCRTSQPRRDRNHNNDLPSVLSLSMCPEAPGELH